MRDQQEGVEIMHISKYYFNQDKEFGERGEKLIQKYFMKVKNCTSCEKVDYKLFDYDLLAKKDNVSLRIEVKSLRPSITCTTMLLEQWSNAQKTKRPHHWRNCDTMFIINFTEHLAHQFRCDETFWSFLESQHKKDAYFYQRGNDDGRRCQKFLWPNKNKSTEYDHLPSFIKTINLRDIYKL